MASTAVVNLVEREGGALEWAKTRNCTFELTKTAFVIFSKRTVACPEMGKRLPTPRFAITIGGTEVQPVRSAKFLGLTLHQTLCWKEQALKALAKGTAWVTACRRITRQTKGVPLQRVLQMFQAVCLAGMLYAVDVWCPPNPKQAKHLTADAGNGIRAKMARVQRQALLQITGAMRNTATDTMEAHLNILPTHLLIKQRCFQAYLRMLTLPAINPIHGQIRKAYKHLPRYHHSVMNS